MKRQAFSQVILLRDSAIFGPYQQAFQKSATPLAQNKVCCGSVITKSSVQRNSGFPGKGTINGGQQQVYIMSRLTANALLLLAALIWGGSFVFQKTGLESLGPVTFTGVQFLIGSLIVLPFAIRERRTASFRKIPFEKSTIIQLVCVSAALMGALLLQQIGLMTSSVTSTSFLSCLYVPLVPVIGWLFLREKPSILTLPPAMGCVFAAYLLGSGGDVALGHGEMWIIMSAFGWAIQVILVGRLVDRLKRPMMIAFTQFLLCGIFGTLLGFAIESPSFDALQTTLPSILYTGILTVGTGFTLQVVAQRFTAASDAALIMGSEALFGALAGAIFFNETMGLQQTFGAALMVTCVIAVQILPLYRYFVPPPVFASPTVMVRHRREVILSAF